ncbi:taste receptor type 2 member 40-like [Dendrobates tinctorius]|uniref:taste receptor type 2 member 40-like n=1 Tax=Dendrobates tinctorius TaxID=92724 RepID=UPI003CC9F5EA
MALSLLNVLSIVLYIQCFAGITVNLIIAAASINKWKTQNFFLTCDKILSCLVISRSLSIFNVFMVNFLYQFYPWIIQNFVVKAALLTNGIFLHYTDLWFATVLFVFYCVKITSYNWKFFIILKTKISILVPWFLLASLIIAISSSLPFGLYLYDLSFQDALNSSEELISENKVSKVENLYSQSLIVLAGSYPPFIIFMVANCLLVCSLWMHTRRMRSSGSKFRSPNLECHVSAVKNMSFFLVLQMIYFLYINLLYSGSLRNNAELRAVSLIIICSLPFFHSLYMICSCREIKKALVLLWSSLF